MTGKERIMAVLEGGGGGEPDRAPIMHISFSSRVASEILGRDAHVGGGMQQWREAAALWNGPDAHEEFRQRTREDAFDIALACGHDMVRPTYWRYNVKPTERIDEYTFRYEHADGTWEVMELDIRTELYNRVDGSEHPPLTLEDLESIVERSERGAEAPAPTEESFADLAYALERAGDELAVRAPCPWTSIPIDEPAWLEAALLRPDLVARHLEAQTTTSLKNIEVVTRMGAQVLFGGGDFASDLGPMYSPQVFHDLMLPCLKRISDKCHDLGAYHLFGTDGNVWAVAEDMYGASGLDGHYEFDRRAGMSPPEVNEKYPHIAMFGNVSSHTLHTGTPEDVRRETRECLEEAKATNKVVTGCSNIIISETSMENVRAMLETIEKHR